jgi:RNA polymerase sigma-70 factor, ECF subfamily
MLESTLTSAPPGEAIGLTWQHRLDRRSPPPVAAVPYVQAAPIDIAEQLARHRPILRAYLRLQLGRSGDVDELEQDISVALWSASDSFQAERSFTAWMLGFARIHILRWRQKRARDQRLVTLDEVGHDNLVWAGEQIIAEGDSAGALKRCLGEIDRPSASLLRWRYSDGLPLADIAKRLHLSVATTSRRLSRLVGVLDGCIRKQLARQERPAP